MNEMAAAATAAAVGAGVDKYEAYLYTVSLVVSMEALWMRGYVAVVVDIDLGPPQFGHSHPKSRWVKDEHIYPPDAGQTD